MRLVVRPVVDLWSSSSSSRPGPNAAYGEAGGGANWTLALTVPPHPLAPSTSRARCGYSRGYALTYQPVAVTPTVAS